MSVSSLSDSKIFTRVLFESEERTVQRSDLLYFCSREEQEDRLELIRHEFFNLTELKKKMNESESSWHTRITQYLQEGAELPDSSDMQFFLLYFFVLLQSNQDGKLAEITEVFQSMPKGSLLDFCDALISENSFVSFTVVQYLIQQGLAYTHLSEIFSEEFDTHQYVISWLEEAFKNLTRDQYRIFSGKIFDIESNVEFYSAFLRLASKDLRLATFPFLSDSKREQLSILNREIDREVERQISHLDDDEKWSICDWKGEKGRCFLLRFFEKAKDHPDILRFLNCFIDEIPSFFQNKESISWFKEAISIFLKRGEDLSFLQLFLVQISSKLSFEQWELLTPILLEGSYIPGLLSSINTFSDAVRSLSLKDPNLVASYFKKMIEQEDEREVFLCLDILLPCLDFNKIESFFSELLENSTPLFCANFYSYLPKEKQIALIRFLQEERKIEVLVKWLEEVFFSVKKDPLLKDLVGLNLEYVLNQVDPSLKDQIKGELEKKPLFTQRIREEIDLFLPGENVNKRDKQHILLQKLISYFSHQEGTISKRRYFLNQITERMDTFLNKDRLEFLFKSIPSSSYPLVFYSFPSKIYEFFSDFENYEENTEEWCRRIAKTIHFIANIEVDYPIVYFSIFMQGAHLFFFSSIQQVLFELLKYSPNSFLSTLDFVTSRMRNNEREVCFLSVEVVLRELSTENLLYIVFSSSKVQESTGASIVWSVLSSRWTLEENGKVKDDFFKYVNTICTLPRRDEDKKQLLNKFFQTYNSLSLPVLQWLKEDKSLSARVKSWYIPCLLRNPDLYAVGSISLMNLWSEKHQLFEDLFQLILDSEPENICYILMELKKIQLLLPFLDEMKRRRPDVIGFLKSLSIDSMELRNFIESVLGYINTPLGSERRECCTIT